MYKFGLLFCTVMSMIIAQQSMFDFSKKEEAWFSVNDNVMGGISKGGSSMTEGSMKFSGELSLENNGGFSSIRSPRIQGQFADAQGIAVRVKGDGRLYYVNLYTDVRIPAGSYRNKIQTVPGKWLEIFLPFAEFKATSFGREIPFFPKLNKKKIQRVGFMIADKVPGSFSLEVSWIKATKQQSENTTQVPTCLSWLESREDSSFFRGLIENTPFYDLLKRNLASTVVVVLDKSFAKYSDEQRKMLQNNYLARHFFLAAHIRVEQNLQVLSSQKELQGFPAIELRETNIVVKNGIVHVGMEEQQALRNFLQEMSLPQFVEYTIALGSSAFNLGYANVCRDVYYLSLGFIGQNYEISNKLQQDISESLKKPLDQQNAVKGAWEFRYLLDRAYALRSTK